jgi:hypothetical protein
LKSIEERIATLVELARKHGKTSEASAIMKESPGKQLERKLSELEVLTKSLLESFSESAVAKNALVESFKHNFGMTEAQAKIAAGDGYAPKRNGGYAWDDLKG